MRSQCFHIFFIFLSDIALKGRRVDGVQSGSHWIRRYTGLCPNVTHDGIKLSRLQCGNRCASDVTCRGFFYTSDTMQCRLRSTVYHESADLLEDSPSTDYYELENAPAECLPDNTKFRIVLLDNNDQLNFRIFRSVSTDFHSAVDTCVHQHGGTLIRIFTAARHHFLKTMLSECEVYGPFWVDATNKHATDYNDIAQWTTVDGDQIPMTFWHAGEPYKPSSRHCVRARVGEGINWETKNCGTTQKFICEL